MLRVLNVAVLGGALLLAAQPAQTQSGAPQFWGTVRMIDGDTLEISGRASGNATATRVRLHGIDAPENDQHCGQVGVPTWGCGAWVTAQAQDMFDGQLATCEQVDQDQYGRTVARCTVAGPDGQRRDMGRTLVLAGLAFAFRAYAMDYDLDEKTAVVQNRGLHGAGVQSPDAFRAFVRRSKAATRVADAPPGCLIKGNLSGDGKRIYHMPGQSWYTRTEVNIAQGERWFCSEQEARAAGWRRARR